MAAIIETILTSVKRFPLILLLLLGLIRTALCQATLGTIFQTKSAGPGSCDDSQVQTLKTLWLPESWKLLQSGLAALSDAVDKSSPNYDVARRYATAYWGIIDPDPSDDFYNEVTSKTERSIAIVEILWS
jgi:hypothetical protein